MGENKEGGRVGMQRTEKEEQGKREGRVYCLGELKILATALDVSSDTTDSVE